MRALIVDDEPIGREYLRSLLEKEPDVEIAGECRNGNEAVSAIRGDRPDVVFLDVQMPGLDGFEVLQALPARNLPVIVFVTAYDEFAVKAFEVQALDYLLKPFDGERFRGTLERVRERLTSQDQSDLSARLAEVLQQFGPERRSLERIAVRDRGETVLVRVEDVDWIQSEANYVRIHVGEKSHLLRSTLNGLVDRLDPRLFVRIHRSIVVNIDRVRRMVPASRGDYRVVLRDGTELNMSRRFREALDRLLGES